VSGQPVPPGKAIPFNGFEPVFGSDREWETVRKFLVVTLESESASEKNS